MGIGNGGLIIAKKQIKTLSRGINFYFRHG